VYKSEKMKAGKISESVLKRSVLKQLHTADQTIRAFPAVGMDFAAVDIGKGDTIVSATQTRCPGSGVLADAGVYAALNNLACSGAAPLGVMINILLPTLATENDLRGQIAAIEKVCRKENIAVLGGHTEVVRTVTEPIITVTAIGSVSVNAMISGDGARPGMDIIVSKWIGLEGTAILALEREKELKTRYSQRFLDEAKDFAKYISVRSEAEAAASAGAFAMHDISEGGVFGALWELGQCSGVGLDIDLKKIPIRQETVEICEFFDLNPYRLISGGSLLIAASDGASIVRAIEDAGGRASVIGRATEGNDRIIRNGEEYRYMETTQTDEIWKVSNLFRTDTKVIK
jgi:hydrogenase maturation factor